jgi:hypothetical protein
LKCPKPLNIRVEEMERRTLLAGVAGVFGYRYLQDYAIFMADPDRFIEPEHPEVESVANNVNDITDTVDLDMENEYKPDAENFRPAGYTLEHEPAYDCEDHAFIAASVLENLDRDWKMVVRQGHTETHFNTDDGVYRWHVGKPENPEPRGDQDYSAMFDMDEGWSLYDEDWA